MRLCGRRGWCIAELDVLPCKDDSSGWRVVREEKRREEGSAECGERVREASGREVDPL